MFPTVIALGDQLSDYTSIRLHIFPLPYNIGSFLAGQACVATHILSNNTGAAVDCLSIIYQGDNQRNLKSQALGNATTPMQIQALVNLTAVPLGVDAAAMTKQLQQGLESGAQSYDAAKADFKYGCTVIHKKVHVHFGGQSQRWFTG